MILLLPQLGPKLKKYNWLILSTILTIAIFALSTIFPLSTGDRYIKRLSRWYHLIETKQFTTADQVQPKLDQQDISYFAGLHHPRFITTTIKNILKKPNRNTDDLIEVALLYYKMNDLENTRHFLLLAKQADPIRSDIDKLFSQLF